MVGNGMMQVSSQCPAIGEPHRSIRFYAELWYLSEDTVRRWFQEEPGVLRVGDEKNRTGPKKDRRPRIELRIPESVAMRVYRERTKSK